MTDEELNSRLEKMERRQDAMDKLITAVEVLAVREQAVERDVKEIKSDVKTIRDKPGKRWDSAIDRAVCAVIGAAVSFLLSGGSL